MSFLDSVHLDSFKKRLLGHKTDSFFILEFLYTAYCESRESDPPETKSLFAQLGEYLETLPLDTSNAMFFIIIKLCTEHERRAF